jgi:hypothetical protein
MPTPLEKFQSLLRELFQFEDAAELDFGVYRIMKLRRQRMEQWLTVERATKSATATTDPSRCCRIT